MIVSGEDDLFLKESLQNRVDGCVVPPYASDKVSSKNTNKDGDSTSPV